ncbi:hypothetical protein [Formosa haliotis]|uniref:hypothetical protein n=1 Tax=Formosa haliotis TaxID=1555194 RepID=UPI000826FF82|nr:hypothetical protein [Formosa haliotis]
MNDNIFVNRFSKKTNEELEAIGLNEATYTDEARLTALEILKRREDVTITEAISTTYDTLKTKEIKVVANKKAILNAVNNTEPVSANTTTEAIALPELYSKVLILVFSIIFSTLFGGVLMMSNLKKTGHAKARTQVLIFCLLYIFIPYFLVTTFNLDMNLTVFTNAIGGLILTEYFWNKYLGKTVSYKKRDWVKPTLISLAITVPLTFLVLKMYGGMPPM